MQESSKVQDRSSVKLNQETIRYISYKRPATFVQSETTVDSSAPSQGKPGKGGSGVRLGRAESCGLGVTEKESDKLVGIGPGVGGGRVRIRGLCLGCLWGEGG
jgi:hypothetical protein